MMQLHPKDALAIKIVVGFCSLFLLAIWASGSFFSQRCAKAYPNDGLAQERCIFDLREGKRL
jgi:hypothetical protein